MADGNIINFTDIGHDQNIGQNLSMNFEFIVGLSDTTILINFIIKKKSQ